MADVDMIRRTLEVFCLPDQVIELRSPGALGRKCVNEIFADHAALVQRAVELDQTRPRGIYFTPNPIRPDLAGQKNKGATSEDIIRRRWLLLDCDTHRPTGTNATDEELDVAWQCLCRCRACLDDVGMSRPVVACSGNGWHLCYPIDMPNDLTSYRGIQLVVEGLQERCSDSLSKAEETQIKVKQFLPEPKAKLDSTFDAPRIWKLYGTWACKGPHIPETVSAEGKIIPARPHRMTFMVETS